MKPAPLPPDPFDPEDLERFLERAERDPVASEELDFLADVVAAAELERADLLSGARSSEPASAPLLRRPWLLPLAASVLFLAALGAWLATRDGEHSDSLRVALQRAPPYLVAELRAPNRPRDGFEAAMAPYARGDWSAAARSLDEFLAAHPEHGPAHFYLAAAREQLGEVEGAVVEYQHAAAAPDALLADHARFRLALLWLAGDEKERALGALHSLAERDGELARNARELLHELEP